IINRRWHRGYSASHCAMGRSLWLESLLLSISAIRTHYHHGLFSGWRIDYCLDFIHIITHGPRLWYRYVMVWCLSHDSDRGGTDYPAGWIQSVCPAIIDGQKHIDHNPGHT